MQNLNVYRYCYNFITLKLPTFAIGKFLLEESSSAWKSKMILFQLNFRFKDFILKVLRALVTTKNRSASYKNMEVSAILKRCSALIFSEIYMFLSWYLGILNHESRLVILDSTFLKVKTSTVKLLKYRRAEVLQIGLTARHIALAVSAKLLPIREICKELYG